MTYTIMRFYFNGTPEGVTIHPNFDAELVARGLTLEEAQAHTNDPQTSSSTTTDPEGLARTEQYGPWFDGYAEERP